MTRNDEECSNAHNELGEDGPCGHSGIFKETDPDRTNKESLEPKVGKDTTETKYTGCEDGDTLHDEIDPIGTKASTSERIYGGSEHSKGADTFAPPESLFEEIKVCCTKRGCDENVVSFPTRCAAEPE